MLTVNPGCAVCTYQCWLWVLREECSGGWFDQDEEEKEVDIHLQTVFAIVFEIEAEML